MIVKTGDAVIVPNPWWRKGQPTPCKVMGVSKFGLIDLQPNEGNPHRRCVSFRDAEEWGWEPVVDERWSTM